MKLKHYVLRYRRPFVLLIHLGLVIVSYALAFLLRFDFRIPPYYSQLMLKTLPMLVVLKMAIFGHYGLFSGLWRYVGIDDIWRIIKANFFSTLFFLSGVIIVFPASGFPRSIFFLDSVMCFCLIAGVRFATRLLRERFRPAAATSARRTIIVGAGSAGIMVLKECQNNANVKSQVIGFIDDNPAKQNLRIMGVKVIGMIKDIRRIAKQQAIEEIIIAIPSAKGAVIRDIISHCRIPGIHLQIIPAFEKLISGEFQLRPRDIRPEDLLGRETVTIDEKEIARFLEGRRVLITGAGGSIGQELCRQISKFSPKELILLDHNENDVYFLSMELSARYNGTLAIKTLIGDIKDIAFLKNVFTTFRPQVVFHAAAHKHVPLMEFNPAAAAKNNIMGSRNLIYASQHYGAERFVLISSDKAVNPINVMGMSKRIAEMLLQAKAGGSRTKFMAVRFGNVIGSDGSVIPLFRKQIEDGGPLTITHPEVKRYFMSVSEAVSLVLQAAAMGKGGEIFILDMGEQIKITDLAENLVTLSGLRLHNDIGVKFIGLRPGEKLFEELLLDGEKERVTKHNKIFISRTEAFDPAHLRVQVKELERLCSSMESSRIVSKMKDIIAKRQNST